MVFKGIKMSVRTATFYVGQSEGNVVDTANPAWSSRLSTAVWQILRVWREVITLAYPAGGFVDRYASYRRELGYYVHI